MKKTNELGYTFEVDKSLTNYAHERNSINGNQGLPSNIIVLKITKDEQVEGYMLFDTKTQTPLSNALGVEAIACKIDVLKFKQ